MFPLFLLFLLKHAQTPLLVFLEPSRLPPQILLFSWLFCFVLVAAVVLSPPPPPAVALDVAVAVAVPVVITANAALASS
jgi:hypothetical protein